MNTEAEEIETTEVEGVELEEASPEPSENEATGEGEAQEQTEDEVVITIEGETPPQEDEELLKAPKWVKEVRKTNRELQRENRELKAKLTGQAPEPEPMGQKPTLEGCDYDSDKYEADLLAWVDRKRIAHEADESAKKAEATQRAEWEATMAAHNKAKAELSAKVSGYDDAESEVMEQLSVTQQGIILQGAENSAKLAYAIGKSPEKLKELASIKDPVKFAFAVARLETKLKTETRKTPPAPEKTVTGTSAISGSVDSTLERLREEAAKTGDFTKVMAYKRQKQTK